jgi:hypothetical protein
MEEELLLVHPLVNTATIQITPAALLRFILKARCPCAG